MNNSRNEIMFNAALLKVASRCNLDCDYCYVYHHVDQSWKHQPALMGEEVIHQFANRLEEYINLRGHDFFSIVFHGGEPLLYTAEKLSKASEIIRSTVNSDCELSFSVQTNGVLLTDENIALLEKSKIGISISLDGPQSINDLHRVDHAGKSSFDATLVGLEKLKKNSNIFRGVIAVIDPTISPKELFDFFYPHNLPSLDLLLPDATYTNLPPGRDKVPELYINWLNDAFEIWYEYYSDLPVRFFDGLLGSRLGIPSPTDAMGFGVVNLLVIETDGTYMDHDVLKITKPGRATLECNIFDTKIDHVANHPKILEHNYLLSIEGIAQECKTCPIVDSCGGGAVMHRFHPKRGFNAPTVYCRELFELTTLATSKLRQSLDNATPRSPQSEILVEFNHDLEKKCVTWRSEIETIANGICLEEKIERGYSSAASIILNRTLKSTSSYDPEMSNLTGLRWLEKITIQSSDPSLVKPFENTICAYSTDSAEFQYGLSLLPTCEVYLSVLSSYLPSAIRNLISDILFVKDTTGGGGIFSFSDDNAPNVLYIAPFADGVPIKPEDLTDSILHEFLHQVLYHMERNSPLLYDYNYPKFPAPWRSGMRPAGGFIHGTYVFAGLARYWNALSKSDLPEINKKKAISNAKRFKSQASYGINAISQFALLTPFGQQLIDKLAYMLGVNISKLRAPGVLS